MSRRLTKTFVENRYWRRPVGSSPGVWVELARAETGETPLDTQIRDWVSQTGAVLIHPGQLGMMTNWLDAELTLKCVTLGLTVLYTEVADGQRESTRSEVAAYPAERGGGAPAYDGAGYVVDAVSPGGGRPDHARAGPAGR